MLTFTSRRQIKYFKITYKAIYKKWFPEYHKKQWLQLHQRTNLHPHEKERAHYHQLKNIWHMNYQNDIVSTLTTPDSSVQNLPHSLHRYNWYLPEEEINRLIKWKLSKRKMRWWKDLKYLLNHVIYNRSGGELKYSLVIYLE